MKRLFLLASLLFALPAHANDWSLLERPGAVAMMRHALAPGTGDPTDFDVSDCATQRNLDARGRAQARRIGAVLRERGVRFDAVLSSAWCRCIDTAREMDVGTVEVFEPLNSFFRRRERRDEQTEALRAFLAARPDDYRPMLVTHQVNITAFTGVFPSSGEIVVLDVSPDGTVEVLGTLLVDP